MTRQLRPCGTRAAYQRHRRNGEVPCDLCVEANRLSNDRYRKHRPRRWQFAHAASRQARVDALLGELIHTLAKLFEEAA